MLLLQFWQFLSKLRKRLPILAQKRSCFFYALPLILEIEYFPT